MCDSLPPTDLRRPRANSGYERTFAPVAARFVFVDTGGWFWIRTVGAPRDGDPRDGELHPSTREGATFAASQSKQNSVETELVALDVLHHEARLVVAIGRQ
jgi:hypothetical protein